MYNKPFNTINTIIEESWKTVAPFWHLKNLIAVNPLQGFQDLPIEKALITGATFFQQKDFPKAMESVNRQTIKWLQAFFDEGQSTIKMAFRTEGLYKSWKKVAYFDNHLHQNNPKKKEWLLTLSDSPETAIAECLSILKVPEESQSLFLTLMLTTLPGWASHIQYRTSWSQPYDYDQHPASKSCYTAMRIIITTLVWEKAADLLDWHKKSQEKEGEKNDRMTEIEKAEDEYIAPLLNQLRQDKTSKSSLSDAQLIFCIDVRSEPFRKALEESGDYETFGYAGFFGIPTIIKNTLTKESYASCPVLLKPKHIVEESPYCSSSPCQTDFNGYKKINTLKSIYQSLKYNATTSFALPELIGFPTSFWMALKTIKPLLSAKICAAIIKKINPLNRTYQSLENISFSNQCTYAESALRAIGLTKDFSPLIVMCGHRSSTHNNAYKTALDCGACAGHHGGSNARIITTILNTQAVRKQLDQVGITIPESTYFIAAEHNTTTDELKLYDADFDEKVDIKKVERLKNDLKKAGSLNSQRRSKTIGVNSNKTVTTKEALLRSVDWAEVRPEWGLARNASFIIGPRNLTKKIDLEGRAFLHSYNYFQDPNGSLLTGILTAPMIVAQWINSQYLFSTLDNVAYGSGSKITQNITGKIGIMQGNGSDLMAGLPLQSIYKTDTERYHVPVRLMVIVAAPFNFIDKIVADQPMLQNLFRNGWVLLTSIDPTNNKTIFSLDRNLKWIQK